MVLDYGVSDGTILSTSQGTNGKISWKGGRLSGRSREARWQIGHSQLRSGWDWIPSILVSSLPWSTRIPIMTLSIGAWQAMQRTFSLSGHASDGTFRVYCGKYSDNSRHKLALIEDKKTCYYWLNLLLDWAFIS